MGNLGWAAQAPRQHDRADAAADVNLGGAQAVPANFEAQLLGRAAVYGPQERQIDLSTMGVPGEHQAHAMTRSGLHQARIVSQQHRRRVGGNAPQSALQIGAVAEVVDARNVQRIAIFSQAHMAVTQNRDAAPTQRTLDGARTNSKIVVAKYRENTGRRLQMTQDFGDGLYGSTRIGDEIAGKRNQVGLEEV